MPRIIAGSRKKMRLLVPHGSMVRPTTDRIKESLFNVISDDVKDALFLDLFAGTGQIGLEALSRGASFCVFVERNYKAWLVLNENIKKTGFKNVSCHRTDASGYIKKCDEKFDLIYIDPPYSFKEKDYLNIIDAVIEKDLLSNNSKIIIEHDFNVNMHVLYDILDEYRVLRYGSTNITFLKRT